VTGNNKALPIPYLTEQTRESLICFSGGDCFFHFPVFVYSYITYF